MPRFLGGALARAGDIQERLADSSPSRQRPRTRRPPPSSARPRRIGAGSGGGDRHTPTNSETRLSASRPSGEWNDDDYDVLVNGVIIGRISKANAAPVGAPWMWTLAFGHHEDRTPTHGYEATREAAMAAFAKSWRRK